MKIRRWIWGWEEGTYRQQIQILTPEKLLQLPRVKPLKARKVDEKVEKIRRIR
jgi:hypothetical protein